MISPVTAFLRLTFVATLMCFLVSGCGSGSSSGPTESVRVCAAGTFEPSYAGNTALRRWRETPVTVAFANPDEFTFNNARYSDVCRAAFSEWVTATGGTVNYVETTNTKGADVVVTIALLPGRPSVGDTLGITTTMRSGNRLTDAKILLNIWPGMTNAEVFDGFKATAAHEFGHALGIEGHSPDQSDLMYAAHNVAVGISVSPRDLNTLKTAYCDRFGRAQQQCLPPEPERGVIIKTMR